MNATKHGWPSIKHLVSLLPFPSSFSLLPVLMGPSCTSPVSSTILVLRGRVRLLASGGCGHSAGVPAKDTPMPKLVLSDVCGCREYLMRNQCIG